MTVATEIGGRGGLKTERGQAVPLERVELRGTIRGLTAVMEVEQRYRNLENVAIEAIFTFPWPCDAVLLALDVEVGGRRLGGLVVPKVEADARYEKAVAEGDLGVRLTTSADGMYTMSLGNLNPGETCVIRLRYAELMRWSGDRVRWQFPTVIGERYGSPTLAPFETPETQLTAEHRYGLDLLLQAPWADGDVACPSHRVQAVRETDGLRVRLAGGDAFLDRDLVLELRAPGGFSFAQTVPDKTRRLVHVAWRPEFDGAARPGPRALVAVVDCSGSMAGTSMAQVRQALQHILAQLRDEDRLEVVRFGSQTARLVGEVAPVGGRRSELRHRIQALNADMGGTELEAALRQACRIPAPSGMPLDVLLITDGQLWDIEGVIAAARASGRRVFTVGVGAASNERLIRGLAEATGGAAEFVTPNETTATRIVRHFERMRTPVVTDVRVDWGAPLLQQVPARPAAVFDGDTVHLFGWLDGFPETVTIDALQEDGRRVRQRVEVARAPESLELPRIAAARRMWEPHADVAAIALEYQLLSAETDYLVVQERAAHEKSAGFPELRKVAQMHAAGQFGIGAVEVHAVLAERFVRDKPERSRHCMEVPLRKASLKSLRATMPDFSASRSLDEVRAVPSDPFRCGFDTESKRLPYWVEEALRILWTWRSTPTLPNLSLAGLQAVRVPSETLDELRALIAGGLGEREVVIAFLRYVLESLGKMYASADLSHHTWERREVALRELERFARELGCNLDAASAAVARVFEALVA